MVKALDKKAVATGTVKKQQSSFRRAPKKRGRTKPESVAFDEFAALMDRLEGIADRIDAENRSDAMLPDFDAVLTVARAEYEAIGALPARNWQAMLKNACQHLGAKAGGVAGSQSALEIAQTALDATEHLAIRAGYFVGLSCGMVLGAEFVKEGRGR